MNMFTDSAKRRVYVRPPPATQTFTLWVAAGDETSMRRSN
jgi:hypothetical protein